ncbi:hypothetical protein [Bradyrhizobium monzae]|uniref:hypothetical protein n=1 Tax=Bradyrhizobium sp. Oc8 TaxID=2876780 RepID=UPI001F1C8015|nr:hypothetical protein [Bradyrhizobium sp. Oc8]
MWTVSITSTQFADDRLASLSIESPANLHTKEGLGLLVGLWCGRLHDEVQTDQGTLQFSVGFQVGDVVVEPNGGQISNRGRLQTTGGHLKVSQSEIDHAKREGAAGGQIGVNLSKWIGSLAKADVDVGGKIERTTSHSEQKNREYVQHFWRVADAGHNFWRVYGLGLNQENVLEHKIIGDEPLCHILPELESDAIEVLVTFRCSLKDLWFQRTNAISIPTDPRFSQNQAEVNRSVVVARIAAIAISRTAKSGGSGISEGDLILAKQTLRAARQKTQRGRRDRE